jgi:hypothetical protein
VVPPDRFVTPSRFEYAGAFRPEAAWRDRADTLAIMATKTVEATTDGRTPSLARTCRRLLRDELRVLRMTATIAKYSAAD